MYSEGKQIAENNFGTKHPLYTKCINAMGGARLKSKYQTKEVYRSVQASSVTKKGKAKVSSKGKVKRDRSGAKDLNSIVDIKTTRNGSDSAQKHQKLMLRRSIQGSESKPSAMRRNISGAIKAAEVRQSRSKYSQDNLLFANCDSWTSMHCRHARDQNRGNISFNYMQKKKGPSSRKRPGSA